MSETIQTKRCSNCKNFKQFSEFNKNHTRKNGHQTNCKICAVLINQKYRRTEKGKTTEKRYAESPKGKDAGKRTRRKYRKSTKGKLTTKRYKQTKKSKETLKRWNARYPNRVKAVQTINNAIRDGKLLRPDTRLCHYCPKPAQQYHHWQGYAPEHWLDVIPICIPCHSKITFNDNPRHQIR